MERSEAKVRFQDADRLFQSKQYSAALEVLQELSREFPDERHVLYPMARSLTGLKRYDEAREIAVRLATEFHYLPAQELIDRIDRLQARDDGYVETPVLPSGLDDITATPASFGSSRTPPAPSPDAAGGESWQPYLLWAALVVLGFVAIVGVTFTLGRPVIDYYVDYFENIERYTQAPETVPAFPYSAYGTVWITNYAYSWVIGSLCGYMALRVIGALRFDDFGMDMKDVGLYTFFCFLLAFIPILGWIAALVMLKRHFELTFGQLLGVVVLYMVFGLITGLVYGGLYYGLIIFTVI